MFKKVLSYFKEICSIPHGSGNTQMLSDYCVNFAVSHSLRYIRDEKGNIIIFKEGSDGYETCPAVILQGHLDMVCVKDENTAIDFETQGLTLKENDDFIWANGTSLGGDDGIAIAFALAILDSSKIEHPPLEVVFTVDEETGMIGANALNMAPLTSKMLINIDSEEEGTLLVSCAGGIRADAKLSVASISANTEALKISLSGLTGGHSGTEIDKGRLNAAITAAKLLQNEDGIYLSSIKSGSADNAIPSSCEAVVVCKNKESFIKSVTEKFQTLKSENVQQEPDITLDFSKVHSDKIISEADTKKVIDCIATAPDGIVSFSRNVKGLVQTSLNLGIVKTNESEIIMSHALRSSVQKEKEELCSTLSKHYENFGASTVFHSDYPAWEYKENSSLRQVFSLAYKEQSGKDLKISAIHAGLECSIFCGKIDGLDCVSFGPDIYNIHTSDEKLSKKSAERMFYLLLSVLKKLN